MSDLGDAMLSDRRWPLNTGRHFLVLLKYLGFSSVSFLVYFTQMPLYIGSLHTLAVMRTISQCVGILLAFNNKYHHWVYHDL